MNGKFNYLMLKKKRGLLKVDIILNYCNISYGGDWSNSSGNLNIVKCAAGVPTISYCHISYS